ncbi:unnamed protein product, partial [Discosporangium mesarthrocarpum]
MRTFKSLLSCVSQNTLNDVVHEDQMGWEWAGLHSTSGMSSPEINVDDILALPLSGEMAPFTPAAPTPYEKLMAATAGGRAGLGAEDDMESGDSTHSHSTSALSGSGISSGAGLGGGGGPKLVGSLSPAATIYPGHSGGNPAQACLPEMAAGAGVGDHELYRDAGGRGEGGRL